MYSAAAKDKIVAATGPRTLAEAEGFILRSYAASGAIEEVHPRSGRRRILASDLIAGTDLPRFDASAVDGYALRIADLIAGQTTRLRLVGRAAAGHPAESLLGPGQAVRIFTGAPVPVGADCVLMQEDCLAEEGWVIATGGASAKSNVRRRGEDVRAGSIALPRGLRLGTGHLALVAGLDFPMIPVFKRLRVGLFSTGDELARAGSPIRPGQIADVNRPMLRVLLDDLGCEVDDGGILPDHPEAQIEAFIRAARGCDLIVTSGGASVGEEDHLARVIRRRGRLEVWRLKIKPGKPVGLGDIDDCPILALPGNPVAAVVTFLMLGTPLVARLAGCSETAPRSIRLPLAHDLEKRSGRWEARMARIVRDETGRSVAEPLEKSGSAMLSGLSDAAGFVILPEDAARIPAGAPVPLVLLPGS